MTKHSSDGNRRGRRLLTEQEAAVVLGISEFTLARERKRGNIEAIRPGAGWLVRYELAAVEDYKERVRQHVDAGQPNSDNDFASVAIGLAAALGGEV